MTAQFRAPDMHVPSAGELGGAARSLLPSPVATLYYSGLVVTAALGVIEWPVAAAIGVGTALASRGELDPLPRSGGTSRGARAADERAAGEA
ncbi:hypothetical protein ACVGVM_24595 [Pseudonocardia bannensis]|uniref:hypothetical protein n=1 Tax=Pseudonocardia bannensis TaxID=630973 RepID=UPI001B7D06B6|nr:hypothetical protein [Pseudonocardia bannensis]